MTTNQLSRFTLSRAARAAALCLSTLALAAGAQAAGDKTVYDQAKDSAKATYATAKTACDALSANAKDICVAEAKAVRVKTKVDAEAVYKGTPKSREHAIHETAEANYKVAKERCDDMKGNDKDVCVKEAKATMIKAKVDAKATQKGTEARIDANKDKREADYKVAAEKCDAMSGDAKSSCVAAAKAKYKM